MTVGNPGPRTFGTMPGLSIAAPDCGSAATVRPPSHDLPPRAAPAPHLAGRCAAGGDPPGSRRRAAEGRAARAPDRGDRPADLQRQPDRLAAARRAAGGCRRLRCLLRRARGSPRSPSTPATSSTSPARAEPFARQSVEGLAYEMQRAPAYGATLVNVHIGSHRGGGRGRGIGRLAANVSVGAGRASPAGVRLVLENSAGGGDTLGGTLEELAAILDAVPAGEGDQLAFCLDTAHLWGAGYDISHGRGGHVGPRSLRRADRAGSAGAHAPERLALGVRFARGPARAHRRGEDRAGRPGGIPARSAAGGPHRPGDGDAWR